MLGPHLLATLLPAIGAGVGVKFMSGPFGTPWFVLWIGLGATALGAALLPVSATFKQAPIVVDRVQGKLIAEAKGKRTELTLKDVASARFDSFITENMPSDPGPGTSITVGSNTTTSYTLMLARRSGEEIAATAGAFPFFPKADRDKTLAAINGELAK